MAFKDIAGQGGAGGGMKNFWDTLGKRVSGRVVGYKNGRAFPNAQGGTRQSRILILDTGGGVQQQIPLPSDLADDKQIELNAKPGSIVEITLSEFVRTNQPQPYKKFTLRVDDGTDGASAPAPAAAASAPSTLSESDMVAKLTAKVGAAAAAPMVNALKQLYPDPATFLAQLQATLRSQGVAA